MCIYIYNILIGNKYTSYDKNKFVQLEIFRLEIRKLLHGLCKIEKITKRTEKMNTIKLSSLIFKSTRPRHLASTNVFILVIQKLDLSSMNLLCLLLTHNRHPKCLDIWKTALPLPTSKDYMKQQDILPA